MKREGKKGEGKTEEPGRDAKRKEIKRRMERQGERVRIEEKKKKKVLNWISLLCFSQTLRTEVFGWPCLSSLRARNYLEVAGSAW